MCNKRKPYQIKIDLVSNPDCGEKGCKYILIYHY